ncbi:activator of Hsp90 ATPase [Russula ochroleuca]|uniref:Activator of Hsp90 ATPase n=1 Tax=Russula ochroleuca TaxID=152965 RepID=A0A9P5MUX7_9AGAM|nr:activator of Hsp90 ATPase [Russula ochroleuca]
MSVTPMAYSTANWHWKNKTVTPWAKEWFERELATIQVEGSDGAVVSVEHVVSVDGDVELGRRKSKLITIYDCKVVLQWKGRTPDGTEATGKLTIPEVSHEITLDGLSDYVYQWSLTSESSPETTALFALAKDKLPIALETKFAAFPVDLIDTHGKDIIVGSNEPSRTSSPAPPSASAPASSGAPGRAKKLAASSQRINTSTVEVEATFHASADDLFSLLTDEKRIPTWSRAPAKSAAAPDTEYELFGGGVRGKYVSLTPSKEIKQTWALQSPTWPEGHAATLTTVLEQSTDSTKVTFTLDGVPTGMEDETRRNLEGYYVLGFKSIGLGTML